MNINRSRQLLTLWAKPIAGRRWRVEGGSSVLIILVLLACMAVMVAAICRKEPETILSA